MTWDLMSSITIVLFFGFLIGILFIMLRALGSAPETDNDPQNAEESSTQVHDDRSWLAARLGFQIGLLVKDKDEDNKDLKIVLHRHQPLFVYLIFTPTLIFTALTLDFILLFAFDLIIEQAMMHWWPANVTANVGLFSGFGVVWISSGLIGSSIMLVISVVLWTTLSVQVPRDGLANVVLRGEATYYTNTWVFYVPRLMEIVFFSTGQVDVMTSETEKGPTKEEVDRINGGSELGKHIYVYKAYIVQLRQGKSLELISYEKSADNHAPGTAVTTTQVPTTNPAQVDAEEKRSADQIVVLQIVFNLCAIQRPDTIMRAYGTEARQLMSDLGLNWDFAKAAGKIMEHCITPKILNIVFAKVTPILQQYKVDTLLTNVGDVNKDLDDPAFKTSLQYIGAQLLSVNVYRVLDLQPEGGYINLRNLAVQAVNDANRRRMAADAERIAGIQEARRTTEIAKEQFLALQQQLKVEQRTQQMGTQKMRERLKVLTASDASWKIMLLNFEQQSPSDQAAFVRSVAEIARGMKPELNGSSFLFSGGETKSEDVFFNTSALGVPAAAIAMAAKAFGWEAPNASDQTHSPAQQTGGSPQ